MKGWSEKQWRCDADVGEIGEKPDQSFVLGVAIDSEHCLQDDLKGDALRLALHRKTLADRPGIDCPHRDFAHLIEVHLHPLAVK